MKKILHSSFFISHSQTGGVELIRFENVSKIYRTRRLGLSSLRLPVQRQTGIETNEVYRNQEIKALDDVSFHVEKGEFIVVRGPSGSGKTTLLLTAGGMLRPTTGQVVMDGNDIYAMNEQKRGKYRAENIGFVFQMFHLVPYLNVIDNVLLAAGMVGNRAGHEKVKKILEGLGILEREYHKPSELSAGEKQRTALARALFNSPEIILADEPTGNLDPENAAEVIEHLAEFHRDGSTVVVVTHGSVADQYANRIINLRNGCILQKGK